MNKLIVSISITLLLYGIGCRYKPLPTATHQAIVGEKIVETRQHIQRSLILLDIKPFDIPLIKTELVTADIKASEALVENDKAKEDAEYMIRELAKAEEELTEQKADSEKKIAAVKKSAAEDIAAEKKKTAAAEALRIAVEKKYDAQWFAGRTWTLVRSVFIFSGLSILAGVIFLIINSATDWFVIPVIIKGIAAVIRWVIKAVWGMIAAIARGIKGLFQKKDKPIS